MHYVGTDYANGENMEWKYNASACTLCPRECGVDRSSGVHGVCGCGSEIYVARAALHMWEEPCISGEHGSGTVFFSGCPLGCVFCQNSNIANAKVGKKVSVERLSDIFLEQQERGALNINLVTPTHYIPQIAAALDLSRQQGMTLPVVYNSGGYERTEALRMLDGLVDVYLPDMKYMSSALSKKYSKAQDYPELVKPALQEMFRQVGKPIFEPEDRIVKEADKEKIMASYEDSLTGKGNMDRADNSADNIEAKPLDSTVDDKQSDLLSDEEGLIMKRGMIVRHLVLPGCTADSKAVIKYLYDTYGDDIYMSIMSQYTPMPELMPGGRLNKSYPELGRCITQEEYDDVIDYAIDIGVENAFIQEGDVAKDSFIPDFDMLSGV